jgi:hypothetical protein
MMYTPAARRAGRGMVDLQRRADDLGVIVRQAGDEGIGIAHLDHHRAKDVGSRSSGRASARVTPLRLRSS